MIISTNYSNVKAKDTSNMKKGEMLKKRGIHILAELRKRNYSGHINREISPSPELLYTTLGCGKPILFKSLGYITENFLGPVKQISHDN